MVPFADAAETGAQDSVDFVLGGSLAAAANDPTPTGRAGREGTYLSFDGGDFLKYAGQTGGDQTVVDGWYDNWHITTGGEDFTIAMTLCYDAGNGSLVQTLFSTKATSTNQGVTAFIGTTDLVSVSQRGATATVTATGSAALVDGSCYIVGVGHSHAGNETTIWVGTATGEVEAHTFNTGTGAATAPLTIGTSFDAAITTASLFFGADTKLYGLYINNTYMNNTAFGNLLTAMQARHPDVDFTP